MPDTPNPAAMEEAKGRIHAINEVVPLGIHRRVLTIYLARALEAFAAAEVEREVARRVEAAERAVPEEVTDPTARIYDDHSAYDFNRGRAAAFAALRQHPAAGEGVGQ